MAKRTAPKRTTSSKTGAIAGVKLDTNKFENALQVGGIRTGTIDHAIPAGGQQTRVAHVDTGSGLRFLVSLDRGGDIVDTFYNRYSLVYLAPSGYVPPSHAYHRGSEWLHSWPAGLLTSCGPLHIGHAREEDGPTTSLHGHYSNTPAAVEMLLNPDPQRGRYEMLLSMVVRDAKMFGPVVEIRRQIQCVLGHPEIRIFDQITNRGNVRCPHNWLYHVNLGYPLLDKGARLIFRGQLTNVFDLPSVAPKSGRKLDPNRIKRVPEPLLEHAGSGERGVIVVPPADRNGDAHIGLINPRLGLGVELIFPTEAMPRFANWQHFGPGGSYVTGLEPFTGTLLGRSQDPYPEAVQHLDPGQTKRYQLTIRVLTTRVQCKAFAKHDGPVTS